MLYVPGTWTLAPVPGPRCTFFFLLFGWFFQTNTRGLFDAACCFLRLLYFYYLVMFSLSFSAKYYVVIFRQGRMVAVIPIL